MTNKDLISQYVDTGLQLPEYQISKLSSNDKKTYLRKRWIATSNGKETIEYYELVLLSDEQKKIYFKNKIFKGAIFSDLVYNLLDDDSKIAYQMSILNRPDKYVSSIPLKVYSELPNHPKKEELKEKILNYFNFLENSGWDLKNKDIEIKTYLEKEDNYTK